MSSDFAHSSLYLNYQDSKLDAGISAVTVN